MSDTIMQMKTLHIEFTTACNSKCIMCDYWNTEPRQANSQVIYDSILKCYNDGLKTVYFTGGECLLRAEPLFALLRNVRENCPELRIGIVTNGLLMAKYHQEIAMLIDKVIVSLDSHRHDTYQTIRGVDGLELVEKGIRMLKALKPTLQINLRVLVLDNNIQDLPGIIEFARHTRIDKISFLPEDDNTTDAFGRSKADEYPNHHAQIELTSFRMVIDQIKQQYADLLGNILSRSCQDLEDIYFFYANKTIPKRRCDKAFASCVIGADHRVSPCFFIQGTQFISDNVSVSDVLMEDDYIDMVKKIESGDFSACNNCVCPKILS